MSVTKFALLTMVYVPLAVILAFIFLEMFMGVL